MKDHTLPLGLEVVLLKLLPTSSVPHESLFSSIFNAYVWH